MTSVAQHVRVGGGMVEFESAWKSYGEEMSRVQHHERQRSGVPGFVAALGVVAATLLASGAPGAGGLPLALFMLLLGLSGVVLSAFHSVRSHQYRRRAASSWRAIEAWLADAGIRPHLHHEPFPAPERAVRPVLSALLWSLVPLLVSVVGFVYLLRIIALA